MPPAYTAEQIARAKQNGGRLPSGGTSGARTIDTQSQRLSGDRERPRRAAVGPRTVGARRQRAHMRVPSNWRQTSDNDSVTFGPDGAFYRGNSGTGFTHGVQLGVIPRRIARPAAGDRRAHRQPAARATRSCGRPATLVRDVIGGRNALTVDMRNVSEVNRPPGARLAHHGAACAMAACSTSSPSRRRRKRNVYADAFRRMKESIQLTDRETAYRR